MKADHEDILCTPEHLKKMLENVEKKTYKNCLIIKVKKKKKHVLQNDGKKNKKGKKNLLQRVVN